MIHCSRKLGQLRVNSNPWKTQTIQLRQPNSDPPNSDRRTQTPPYSDPFRIRPSQFRPLPIQTPLESDHPNSNHSRFRLLQLFIPSQHRPLVSSDSPNSEPPKPEPPIVPLPIQTPPDSDLPNPDPPTQTQS